MTTDQKVHSDASLDEETSRRLADLDAVFKSGQVSEGLRRNAPTLHAAASNFWDMAFRPSALSPRMKELVLVALHGTVTALDSEAVHRHVRRALSAGASPLDVIDVLTTIVSAANHALYFAMPVLIGELKELGHSDAEVPPLTPEAQAIKDAFIRERGFWNEQRDVLARMMPEYFADLSQISTVSWKDGSLTRKERELICVAIDCTVTHTFEPGLRIHIRNALKEGATADEVLDVFKLASVIGMEGYILSAEALFESQTS
ncbi:carboxymuconolactone decarboxylase [Caballeronia calidae]|uniref:Carboxymuconolactone decarboxylase n=1 Tax=Caballeronia calidae TaxID=1777139 RepID=A0A158DUH3_9BURK|nr:carboxymuconolactone decarboxylase family protein [Caballeronia calidae]SAK98272.1 carboxymuconolactone decarboxylase [Caballeronia calidae]